MGNLFIGNFNEVTGIALPTKPVGELKLCSDDRAVEEMWIAITWSGEAQRREGGKNWKRMLRPTDLQLFAGQICQCIHELFSAVSMLFPLQL